MKELQIHVLNSKYADTCPVVGLRKATARVHSRMVAVSVLTSVLEEFCLSLKQCDPQCTVTLEVLASPRCAEHIDALKCQKLLKIF